MTHTDTPNLEERVDGILKPFTPKIFALGGGIGPKLDYAKMDIIKLADELRHHTLKEVLDLPEMQDEQLNPKHRSQDEEDNYSCVVCRDRYARNQLRADVRKAIKKMEDK